MPKEKTIIDFSDKSSRDRAEDDIRLRAYLLFEQRGCEDGHDLDDWLQAEAEIMGNKPVARADMTPMKVKAVAA